MLRDIIRNTIISLMVLSMSITSYANTQDGEETVYYDTTIKAEDLGNYEFRVETHEVPSKEWLPIVSKDYFPYTVETFQTEVDNTAPSAIYKAKAITKVDVVFAIGNYKQADTFQNYIPTFTANLSSASNAIDANVEQVETEQVDLQNAFQWETDVSPSIGSIDIKDNGRTIAMKGNPENEGKNAMWVLQDTGISKQTFAFDYTLSYGDSFSAAGVLINVGKTTFKTEEVIDGNIILVDKEVIEGYAITFNNTNGSFGRGGGSVYKIVYKTGQNMSKFGVDAQKLADLTGLATSGRLTVEATSTQIKITGGGIEQTVELPEHYGYGLGFFSEHYSHSCDSIGAFNLTNLTLEKTTGKTLGEAISDVQWRDNAIKVVIHVTDVIPDEFKDGNRADYEYTVSKLKSTNTYLINIGSSINRTQLLKLIDEIKMADGKSMGTFIYGTSPTTALNNSVTYILSLIDNDKSVDYILVNTEVYWETLYNDYERDLPLNFGEHDGTKNSDNSDTVLASSWGVGLTHLYKDDKIYAEKWRYRHNNTYYDNAPIVESFSGIWLSDPIEIFPNPGKYFINYKRKDNPFYTNVSNTHIFDEYRRWSTNYD